jgi:hypothetical protein
MSLPQVIFLHGPVASGKLTIATQLSALTGFRLFHNHLTVDLLLTLFPFGSPEFVRLRESIWIETMSDAIGAGLSVIFTFAPERTVTRGFPADLTGHVRDRGGEVRFVEVRCPPEELERRLGAPSRQEFRKLTSLDEYRALQAQGAFEYPRLPADCTIEAATLSPADAAQQIVRRLNLPRSGG